MNDIKPIETKYKGYRFRSRLEARYAVFFDALDLKWEYEKDGFDLPSGWYLPDFWLPEWECWVEVKPEGGITDKASSLAKQLCNATSYPVIVTDGLPDNAFKGTFICKGIYTTITSLHYPFTDMAHAYSLIYLLEQVLYSLEKEDEKVKASKLRIEINRLVNHFARDFPCPRIIDTRFSFQTLYYAGRPKATLYLEYNRIVVYKKLTDCDFKYARERGAVYDHLIRYPRNYPIMHYDLEDRFKELPDDDVYEDGIVGKALTKAKSARFEHGETA